MDLNKLAQVLELRSKDFDTTNRLHFRTSADAEQRITRPKSNDGNIALLRLAATCAVPLAAVPLQPALGVAVYAPPEGSTTWSA